jgi:hypothetical protein
MDIVQAGSNFARNPKIAVREEYDLAIKRGTIDSLERFIARHPDSDLARKAAKRIKHIKKVSTSTSG